MLNLIYCARSEMDPILYAFGVSTGQVSLDAFYPVLFAPVVKRISRDASDVVF